MSYEKISDLVLKLNPSWYDTKKDCFLNETFYNPGIGKIYQVLEDEKHFEDDMHFYDDDGNEYETYPSTEITIIDIDLVKYFWNDTYPNCSSSYDWEASFPVNGSSISYNIVSYLEKITKDVTEVKTIHRCILGSIETINETIRTLLIGSLNETYEQALGYFLVKCKKDISKKFGHIKRINDMSEAYEDKLTFNINQEQLGALLYILKEAGFIDTPTPTDTTFLNFCSDYFYFKNQLTKTATKATSIRNKYNDAKKPQHTARDKVVEMLKEAFKNL